MDMKNRYGLIEVIRNVISLILTKIFYNNARLIRRPIYIRNRKFLKYDKGFTTGYSCRIEIFDTNGIEEKKIIIGKNFRIGDYVHIAAGEKVTIGNNCLMASKVYISDISHGDYSGTYEYSSPDIPPNKRILFTKPISIGNNVWIGENVCILPGVNIGDGCIIGANAVVTKSIPNDCIAVGNPAKVIKKYDREKHIWSELSR